MLFCVGIEMLKSCQYCGRIHDSKYDCGKRPVRKKKFTKADYFRRSQKWTDKSVQIRERDKYLCQICIRKLYGTVNQFNYSGLSVHHIVPLNEDYERRMDDSNLITLCEIHHTMAEDGRIPRNVLLRISEEQEKILQ